jgi:hypothetical protein
MRAASILFLLLLATPRVAEAQETGKTDPFVEAFKQGLRERGYIEGRNIAIEYRWTEGRFEALPSRQVRRSSPIAVRAADQVCASHQREDS